MNHTTHFTVFPDDCNYMAHADGTPMVHGGTMLLRMDRASAELARLHLKNTDCDSALTVGVNDVVFHHGARLGDMIKIEVKPTFFGVKRMSFHVSCFVDEVKMCEGVYHFCSFKNHKPHPHGIKL